MGRVCGTCGEEKNTHTVLVGELEGKSCVDDLDINGRIILKLIYAAG